jgi:hypothetical protein
VWLLVRTAPPPGAFPVPLNAYVDQKQPGSQIVRVLKAVTLDRMGRTTEALVLADAVRLEVRAPVSATPAR